MGWVALQMLIGDRAKYLGLIFGIAFGSMLMAHQTSIFCGLMLRTTSQIRDVAHATVWVMDRDLASVDEAEPLSDGDLYRVRGVPGVAWAVPLHKGLARIRTRQGNYRTTILLGIDDASLVGAPQHMLLGSADALTGPDAIILDDAGYEYLWPGAPLELGRALEMNDRRAVVVGICRANPPFQTFPVAYARYSQALSYIPRERNVLTFVLARGAADISPDALAARIQAETGLQALSRDGFVWKTIGYYIGSTGIPINFGITIFLGFLVGTAVAGQTFYLFVVENLRQFGALKAMGLSNGRILGMILLQALVVGVLGFAIGLGSAALFFEFTKDITHLRGFVMPWQVALSTACAVGLIIVLASVLSIRKVWVLEPAIVFRG